MTDHALQLNAAHREALRRLLTTPKFNADRAHSYAGAPSERIRALCEGRINDLLGSILDLPESPIQAEAVFSILRRALKNIDAYGSEERDRYCLYLTQVMDILGVENAATLLEKWRYGD